jgi:catechol 2,3-dioxygenase
MAKIPQLKHLGIYVDDIQMMENFYTSVFDLIVTDRGQVPRLDNRNIVFMSGIEDAHHQLVLIDGKDPMSGPSVVFQMSFFVDHLDDLRRIEKRLIEHQITRITPITHGNAWSIYSHDPEGNGLEIYMDTPWHVAQPHGKPFDLSMSDEAIFEFTENLIKENPSFTPQEDWRQSMRTKLGSMN